MPTKTDRILSYLPSTFRALPKPTALHSTVEAFGNELLQAENSLAAVMTAHWVDHADRGAELIQDLACLAALYGLRPRGAEPPDRPAEKQPTCPPSPADESVEEFREHLKRFVRTFLEGTVTVQGILRVTAEALGLRLNDDYAQLDTWWTRPDEALSTVAPRGDDVAQLLFGVEAATLTGQPARPARIAGQPELLGTVDLGSGAVLRLKVDGAAPVTIDLPAQATLDQIRQAINDQLGATVATHDPGRLTLASPTIGPNSRLAIEELAGDAAPRLLGLLPHTYHGVAAIKAQVRSVELGGEVDLRETRYLRLLVDGERLAEIDCAESADPAHTKLDHIKQAINDALGVEVASHDNHFLTLTSPAAGFKGSIAFQRAAAQDAKERLLGSISTFHLGSDALPAEAVGAKDLSRGVDLSARSQLRVRVNDKSPVTVDCAGATPSRTLLSEMVAALTAQLGVGLASHDGRFLHLASPTMGPESRLTFEPLPAEQDATEILFGIGPRTFQGAPATSARLVGQPDLSAGVNLGARHAMQVGLDGGPLIEVDVRSHAANRDAVTLTELSLAINAALGPGIAADDGEHLILASPTTGGASRIVIEPLEVARRRRFVTRGFISDEAAPAIFGFLTRHAQGVAATPAQVVGRADLSRGVDLREARYLRLVVDDRQPEEIDCAGTRPRTTMVQEVAEAINQKLGLTGANGPKVASPSPDGRNVVLTSLTTGAASRIAFEEPRGALKILLGLEPQTFRGQDATGVNLIGTVDLSAGVDLSGAGQIKIGVGAQPPVDISCASASNPKHTSLGEIVSAINQQLGQKLGIHTASHDGQHLILTSPAGADSRIEFAVPAGPDATTLIFGFKPPRTYHGSPATPARAIGLRDLSLPGADLSAAHFLRLAVNGGQPVDVDCAASATDPTRKSVPLEKLVQALTEALGGQLIARDDGQHLILESKTLGAAARLDLLTFPGDDARQRLLGDQPAQTRGSDPAPALIKGEADLLTPVNLAERGRLRFSVDDGRPVEVNVAGAAPGTTFLDEIVARIDAVVPGLASATDDDRLRLTAPTRGEESRLELLPTRWLELIEYPPGPAADPASHQPARLARHGDRWTVNNEGVAEADLTIELSAPQGVAGAEFVNRTTGQRLRLMTALRPGERAVVWRDVEAGLQATIIAADDTRRSVPGSQLLAGPLGAQVSVPFDGQRSLSRNSIDAPTTLQLNNPLAPSILLLRAREPGPGSSRIKVSVAEAKLVAPAGGPVVADGHAVRLIGRIRTEATGYRLTDADEKPLAHLRAGPGIALKDHLDRVVAVEGPLHAGDGAPPLMVVERLADLFDVQLHAAASEGVPPPEPYSGVTIGLGEGRKDSLAWQINFGQSTSQLVRAAELNKAATLRLPRGQSQWSYLDCHGARFNHAWFNAARFAGARCVERAVFDISRFSPPPPELDRTVFASAAPVTDPPVEIRFHWLQHQPGAFVVNLPAELPEPFGGRFNQARFASAGDKVEKYDGVVTEPPNDQHHLKKLLNDHSKLVVAEIVPRVELGFEAVPLPIRRPSQRQLSGGTETQPARLYLTEKDVPGFIKLSARQPGAVVDDKDIDKAKLPGSQGNAITVTARKAGPALFDVTVNYQGARFESARRVVRGGDQLPEQIDALLRPGPVGILQAKAAGIHAEVTRDGTAVPRPDNQPQP